jgi:HAD superfamily phosphatase (TIGR01668 family)
LKLRELLEPNWVAKGSLADLPLEVFTDLNIKALVLDVDCTLLPRHSHEIPADVLVWLQKARLQWRLHLFSNNPNRRRIEVIANAFALPFTAAAGKPRRGPLRLVLNQLQLPAPQVALIGDRVFTDVLAGNRLGLFTVLVHPVGRDGKPSGNHRLQRGERTLARWLGARMEQGLPQR